MVGQGIRVSHLLCMAVMAGASVASRALWPSRKDGVAYRPGLAEQASRGHGRAIEGIEDRNGMIKGSLNFLELKKGLSFLSGPYKEFTHR